VGRFLDAAGAWGSQNVTSVSLSGSNVVVKGGGRTETMSVTDFRSHLNYWAPCLDPNHYPTGGLPQTVPSKWFTTSNQGGTVSLTGRGWGHGVGMVQWGAYGKALRGVSYQDILADYYGGLRPKPYEAPSTIRIGIATGLKTVTVEATDEEADQVTVIGSDRGPGPWLVTGGKRLRVKQGRPAPSYISKGRILEAPTAARVGHRISVRVSVPQLSVARLILRAPGPDGDVGKGITVSEGTATLSGTVPDLPPATYRLQAEVTDGTDIVRTQARRVLVTGGTVPTASPSPSPSSTPTTSPPLALAPTGSSRVGTVVAIAVAGAIALGLGTLLVLRRRRTIRASPP
jgi:hypothetical protein